MKRLNICSNCGQCFVSHSEYRSEQKTCPTCIDRRQHKREVILKRSRLSADHITIEQDSPYISDLWQKIATPDGDRYRLRTNDTVIWSKNIPMVGMRVRQRRMKAVHDIGGVQTERFYCVLDPVKVQEDGESNLLSPSVLAKLMDYEDPYEE